VTARLTGITRPVITLSEALSSYELEQLLMLTCNIECNHGNVSWGGSWAGHAITCLLQDVLEGNHQAQYILNLYHLNVNMMLCTRYQYLVYSQLLAEL